MNTKMKIFVMSVAGAGLVFVQSGWALAGNTAQSAMIESTIPSIFVIDQNETWAWDQTTARTYYTNAWDGNTPTRTCTGGGGGGCMTGPATPAAPAPLASNVNAVADGDQCTFFDGGTLIGTSMYTRVVQIVISGQAPAAQRGTWRWTYTYNIAPLGGGFVAPHTAWNLTESSGASTVALDIDATIAGQSVNHNPAKGNRAWTRKYSFTLVDDQGASRVVDLKVILEGTDADGNPVGPTEKPATHTVLTNLVYPDNDFEYTGNAGENGQSTLLAARPVDPTNPPPVLVSHILDGVVPGFDGKADDFPNNNSTVAYTTTVHKAVMEPVSFDVGAGCYTATISGNIKGVAGSMDIPLSGSKNVSISALSCGTVATIPGCE